MTISLPRPPERPARHPFPLLASVAPVVASLAIWAFTSSPFALVFALLGPVVALAGLGDARRRSRAELKEERARFERELVAAIHAVEQAHEQERVALGLRHPDAVTVLRKPAHDPERWRCDVGGEALVRLGTGRIRGAVAVDGEPGADDVQHRLALEGLRDKAAVLERAPVVVDARLGIGLCGPPALVAAFAAAILVQLADALSPETVQVTVAEGQGPAFTWVTELPHAAPSHSPAPPAGPSSGVTAPVTRIEFRERVGSGSIVLVGAAEERLLPRECRIVVRLSGSEAAILRHPDPARLGAFVPGFASARQGADFASKLREAAGDRGGAALPEAVAFSELPAVLPRRGRGRAALPAVLGIGAAGPVLVDLVADGPHAIVGGTTGSGKSELLAGWVLSMAAMSDPTQVSFLLVDFKGGASFASVRDLPHVVGLVTDLDEPLARRAVQSLRTELRRRERILVDHAARFIDELAPGAPLARLVIVVDEFATLVTTAPEFHELFADLAARGRSLGIHLILCTQRPAGIVRDAVLANCTLSVSLRVNNRADSMAVLGVPDAEALPRHPEGRAILSRGDGSLTMLQVALVGPDDVARVSAAVDPGARAPHRPWRDPLPAVLDPHALPPVPAGIAFGLLDLPEEQHQEAAVFDPLAQGNLLVLGARGSGRSTALAALARGSRDAVIVPDSVEGAWDTVLGALEEVRTRPPVMRHSRARLIVFDDVDAVVGRFPLDHEAAFLDALVALAREGSRAGTSLVLAAGSAGRRLQALAGLCEASLLLRMPSREEHVLSGGAANGFDPGLPAGRGRWRGHDVQVVMVEPLARVESAPATELGVMTGPVAVVSAHPTTLLGRLERCGAVTRLDSAVGGSAAGALEVSRGDSPHFVLGDPDAWQSAWGLLATLRASGPVLFHGCSLAEFRSLARTRVLPPPLASAADTLWMLHPDGRVDRARLAGGTEAQARIPSSST